MMGGLTAGQNTSGFYGYSAATIYPGYGTGYTQTMDTIPEPAEQVVLADVESPPPTPVVEKKKAMNMWMLFGVLVLILVLFGAGRG